MYCKKCSGRVFIDRMFCENSHIELFCSSCGKRWAINKEINVLAKCLATIEKRREGAYGISS